MWMWYGCYEACVDITRTLNPRRTRVGRHGRRQLCWRVVTDVVLATLFWCLFLLSATLAVLEKPYLANCLSSSACHMDRIWSRDQRKIALYKSDQPMNQSVIQSIHPSIHRSINQSINPINQSIIYCFVRGCLRYNGVSILCQTVSLDVSSIHACCG